MTTENHAWDRLQPLFRPEGIAIIGASQKWGPGQQVIRNLEQLGYQGEIFPINPKYDTVVGLKCYPSLTALSADGKRCDIVAILLGRDAIPDIIEEAASAGVRAAWAFAAGFGELGSEGKALEQALIDACQKNGIVFLGPNCIGYLNPSCHVGTYSAAAPVTVKPGHIGIVAQSGYLTMAIVNSKRDLGFSLMVSTGNETIINSTDVMEYMLEDPETNVIMAFIEQFRDPEKLKYIAARSRELGKPIIFIKVGKSAIAQRATSAHTGALAGSDAIQDAVFRKLGLIRVDDMDEMFETAELFTVLGDRMPRGNRVFAVTLSGGVISLLGDLSEDLNMVFPPWSARGKETLNALLSSFTDPNNPLDAWGSGKIENYYETCLFTAAEEPDADLILVVQDVPPLMSQEQVQQYSVVADAAVSAARQYEKPFVMLTNTSTGFHPDIKRIMDNGRIPLLQGSRPGLKAIAHAIDFGTFQPPAATGSSTVDIPLLCDHNSASLTEFESKNLLRQFGIPCTRELLTHSVDECIKASRSIGYPVVLKVMSPQIPHKTDAGIIALNLKNAREVSDAYSLLIQRAKAYSPSCTIGGVLVQEMTKAPVAEMIIGISNDPQFGPAVVLGSGGILVEILKDSVLGIPPFDHDEALRMIRSIKGYRLLTGFRGAPKGDVSALADCLVRVGNLALSAGEQLAALDINPVFIFPEGQGIIAVDALAIPGRKAVQE